MEITSNPNRSGAALGFVPLRTMDVLLLCGGSAADLPEQSPRYAGRFHLLDSFDTHAYLNDLRSGHASTKESEQFQRRLNRYRERYLFPDENVTETEDKQA